MLVLKSHEEKHYERLAFHVRAVDTKTPARLEGPYTLEMSGSKIMQDS